MADTIKEFLVGLGYKIDESSQRRFIDSVVDATTTVGKLGAAVEAAAAAVVAGVAKMASGLEDLYYVSQRTKATAENIQAIGFAAGQMGGSVEGARSSLENLARTLRTMPGSAGILQSLGIDARQDPTKILEQFGQRARNMPYFRANAYAQALGIDEKTLMALMEGTEKFSDEYRGMLRAAGIDSEKATKSSHDFMVSLRGLGAAVEILGQKVAATLTGRMGADIDRFRKGLVANFERLTEVIVAGAKAILTISDAVVSMALRASQVLGDVFDWFNKLDPRTKEILKTIGLLIAAWYALSAAFWSSPVGRIIAVGAAILALYDDYKAWKEGAPHLIDWEKWGPGIEAAWTGIKKIASAIDDVVKAIGGENGWMAVFAGIATYIAGAWLLKIATPILAVLRMLSLIPGSGVTVAAVSSLAAAAGLTVAGVAVGAAAVGAGVAVANGAEGKDGSFDPMGAVGRLLPGVGLLNRAWNWMFPGGGQRGAGSAPSARDFSGIPSGSSGNDAKDAFIRQNWQHAMAAARETGLDPRLILAQSALETNWGRSAPGNNMFGIKGPGQMLNTQEYSGGSFHGERASFRAYGSAAESFADYAAFLKRNPRYAAALAANGLGSQAAALGNSGYATDPAYGSKLLSIANGISSPQLGIAGALNAPLGAERAMPSRGENAAPVVTQTNNITVQGDMSHGTANAVLSELNRTNQDVVRNFKGSAQ